MPVHPRKDRPRREKDNYQTPYPFARQICEHLDWTGIKVTCDPCAGQGSILRAMMERSPQIAVWGNDAHNRNPAYAMSSHDILDLPDKWGNGSVDRIVTNLPYSILEDAFRACLRLVTVDAIFLMPVGWLYTKKRYASLHSRHLAADEWRLPCRPSFAHGGNDFGDYVWLRYLPSPSLQPTRVHYLPPISRKEYT